jgi:thiol-disulfide isomerase/thioredoxin
MSQTTRVLFTATLGLLTLAARADLKPGDPFPSLNTAGLSGTLPATEDRVVLVDFWASWCSPCRASFPAYARLQAGYAARGLVIVAVSVDENPAAYAAFVKRFHPPFATLQDASQQLVSQVNVPTMPTCYLLGRDGRVRFRHQGFHGEEVERDLRREIETLLAEASRSS